MRIARDIHDIVGHTIAGVTIQAGLAEDALDRRPDQSRSALKMIRSACQDALSELKAALGVLRAGGADQEPAPGLGRLNELLGLARESGLSVRLARGEGIETLPAVVEMSAYRIVQEALTNVIRHARATEVVVSIQRDTAMLVIEVTDNGHATTGAPGHGIVGMTERAQALGGRLDAGRNADGGFRVQATLPVARETAR
jgi:signal transduction histidine kinase